MPTNEVAHTKLRRTYQNLPTQEKTLSAPFDAFEARVKADAQKALANFAATAELAKTRAKIDEIEVS